MRRVLRTLESNRYRLNPNLYRISRSKLTGRIVLGHHVRIEESVLSSWVEVEDHAKILGAVVSGHVTVGRYSSLNGPAIGVHALLNSIDIGRFCSIAKGVTIQEYNHRMSRPSTYFMCKNVFGGNMASDVESRGPIRIGHDVWVGANATILSGVTIGCGAVIAAGAVVASDVPDYAVVGGVPSKILKWRFAERDIAKLLDSRWWEWSDREIQERREFFLSEIAGNL